MNQYYHCCLTCPSCHAPHDKLSVKSNKSFKILENGIAICSHCNCHFECKITMDYKNDSFNEPLFWKIIPNFIEKSYISWIKTKPVGNFIIYWPWENVKFIPLLINEYIKINGLKRPIVVYSPNIQRSKDSNNYKNSSQHSPYPNVLWEFLIEIKNSDYNKPEWQKNLFKKLNKISIPYKQWKIIFKTPHHQATVIAPTPHIDLPPDSEIIQKKELQMREKILYTKQWLTDVIQARIHNQITKPSTSNKKAISITSSNDFIDIENNQNAIWFIKSTRRGRDEIQPDKRLLKDYFINPQLVIFENIEVSLHAFRRRGTVEFINNLPDDCLILLFSTTPEHRYLHTDLEKICKIISRHCWDTPIRKKRLESIWNEETKYASPGSNLIKEFVDFDFYEN